MYLIAGLGNPEAKYNKTRHNVGFEVIDRISSKTGIPVNQKKFRGLYGKGMIGGEKVILLKPQTYMNLSGESISSFLKFFDIDPAKELIVICDDIALDVGRIRVRQKGSAGGHNGLKNIISHLQGSNEFLRVRVGVGDKPENGDLVNHVLGRFSGNETEVISQAMDKAALAAIDLLTQEVGEVMSRYNRKD